MGTLQRLHQGVGEKSAAEISASSEHTPLELCTMDRRNALQFGLKHLLAVTTISALGTAGFIEYDRSRRVAAAVKVWDEIKRLDPSCIRARSFLIHQLAGLDSALQQGGANRAQLVRDEEFKAVLVRHTDEWMREHYGDFDNGRLRAHCLNRAGSIAYAAHVPIFELVPEATLREEVKRVMRGTITDLCAAQGAQDCWTARCKFEYGVEILSRLTTISSEEVGVSTADRQRALFPFVQQAASEIASNPLGKQDRPRILALRRLLEYCQVDEASIGTLPAVAMYRRQYLDALNLRVEPDEDIVVNYMYMLRIAAR